MNIFIEKRADGFYFYDCGSTERIQAQDTILYDMSTFSYAYRTKPSPNFDGTDDSGVTGNGNVSGLENFEGDPNHQVSENDKKKDFRVVNVDDKIAIYKHILFTEKYNFNNIQWKQYGHGYDGKNSPMTEDQVYGLRYPKDENNTKLGKFVSLVLPYLQTWYIPLGMYSGILNSGHGALAPSTGIAGESVFSGSTNAEIIWNFLVAKGLPEIQTAAILGNIEQEANFNPSAIEAATGEGYGIVQWSYSRKTQLLNYAQSVGKDWSTMEVQLEFLWAELQRDGGGGIATFQFIPASAYDSFMNASTPTEAANIFCTAFERPNESDANRPVRTASAENYYKLYKGKSTSSTEKGKTKIEGTAKATEKQMQSYLKNVNPGVSKEILDLIPIYLSEGEKEGIRGDIAFALSCVETQNFTFVGSSVTAKQNNFGGLGVTSKSSKGESYKSAEIGIRAQIQHLKAFANKDALKVNVVDKSFKSVTRGSAPYVEYLGSKENPKKKGWSSKDKYGNSIIDVLSKITGENASDKNESTTKATTSEASQNSKNHYFAYSVIKNAYHDIVVNRYDIEKRSINTKYNAYTRYTKNSVAQVVQERIVNTATGAESVTCRIVSQEERTVNEQQIDERADSSGNINPANEKFVSEEKSVNSQYYLSYALTFDMVYNNNYTYTKYSDSDVVQRINADSEQITSTQPYSNDHPETKGNILPGAGTVAGNVVNLGGIARPLTGSTHYDTKGPLQYYTQSFEVIGNKYYIDQGNTIFMRRTWQDKLTQGNSKAEQVNYSTMLEYNENKKNSQTRSTITTKEFENDKDDKMSYRVYRALANHNEMNLVDIMNSNPKLISTYLLQGSEYAKYMGYTRSYLSMSYDVLKDLIEKARGEDGSLPYAYFASLGYTVSKTDSSLTVDTVGYGGFGWPVDLEGNDESRIINTIFPYTKAYGGSHGAIDIKEGSGSNTIIASKEGKVIKAGSNGGYGNSVLIDHGDGFYTRYSHMKKIQDGIIVGAQVKKGDKLGIMGSTGNSTGTHLDFEIYKDGLAASNRVDPLDYFNTDPEYGSINPSTITKIPSGYKFKSEKSVASQGYSLSDTNFTKKEFIDTVDNYMNTKASADTRSGYNTHWKNNMEYLYDYCTKNQVNPEWAIIVGIAENGKLDGYGVHQYWNVSVNNGEVPQDHPRASFQAALQEFCSNLTGYRVPGTSGYENIMGKYKERLAAGCDPGGYGTPDTAAGWQSAFSYLGEIHRSPEAPAGMSSAARMDYYNRNVVSGTTGSGDGGRYYTYYMYENYNGLGLDGYKGQYQEKCGSVHTSPYDPTTVQEKSDYTKWGVQSKIHIASNIFGDKGGGSASKSSTSDKDEKDNKSDNKKKT